MSSGTAPTSYGGTDKSDPDTEPRKKSLDELLAETYDAIMAREAAAPPEPQLDYSGMTIEETSRVATQRRRIRTPTKAAWRSAIPGAASTRTAAGGRKRRSRLLPPASHRPRRISSH